MLSAATTSRADRPIEEVPNYEEQIMWPDEENDTSPPNSKLFVVSESTGKFLGDALGKGVPNATRKQWLERFGHPKS